jgi:hypothetical protein
MSRSCCIPVHTWVHLRKRRGEGNDSPVLKIGSPVTCLQSLTFTHFQSEMSFLDCNP